MTDGTANCELLRWEWVREGEEGGEERVSDERRASLTVVLRGGEHQSQVIYSLPWPGPSPFFSLVVCVCKHGTKKKKNRMRARSALTPSAP